MNREALRGRLLSDRQPAPPTDPLPPGSTNRRPGSPVNGTEKKPETPAAALWSTVSGNKLTEAARYLASARAALLHWTRDTCTSADNLDTHADHLQEVLGICARLKEVKTTIDFKATLYGEKP